MLALKFPFSLGVIFSHVANSYLSCFQYWKIRHFCFHIWFLLWILFFSESRKQFWVCVRSVSRLFDKCSVYLSLRRRNNKTMKSFPTLKTHQMFSVHSTPQEFRSATCTITTESPHIRLECEFVFCGGHFEFFIRGLLVHQSSEQAPSNFRNFGSRPRTSRPRAN